MLIRIQNNGNKNYNNRMGKQQKITYLEHNIVNKIEEIGKVNILKQHRIDKLYFIVDSILETARRNHSDEFEWVDKPSDFWMATVGMEYKKLITLLEDNNVIRDNGSWRKGTKQVKGQCIKYSIHPDMDDKTELSQVRYSVSNRIKESDEEYITELDTFYDEFIFDLNNIKFITTMMNKMEGHSQAKQRMKRRYWLRSYDNLSERNLYARRNKTNNRLDTNFTNMPKEFRKLIMSLNGLGELDMKNSQPMLLSNMMLADEDFCMNSDPDVSHFHMLCSTGKLNEFMAGQWNTDRDTAKERIYFILFSDPWTRSKLHKDFDKIFRCVYEYIQDKKLNSPNWKDFPISLQKFEASIWVDSIKPLLRENHIIHTTVHDSVMVSIDQLDSTESLIKEWMDINSINGSLRKKTFCDQFN